MAAPQRLEWIDLLRGLAVVGMVWVHSANTLLDSTQQSQPWYQTWSYFHGIVAPTFFWLAGLMRGMAVAGGRPKRPLWPTVQRLLTILAVGYLLHLPQALLQPDASLADRWQVFCQVDVLHCLAVSCLVLVAIERLPRGSVIAMLAVMLGAVLAVPVMAHASVGWAVIDGYLNRGHGSLFPLFPWLGFAAAGWLCGRLNISALLLGGLGLVLAVAMPWVPGSLAHLWFFFERLGWVFMAAAIMRTCAPMLLNTVRSSLEWLLLAGRESLEMYVVHLLLIYAVPLPFKPLSALIGPSLSFSQVVLSWVLLTLVTLVITWWIAQWKARRHERKRLSSQPTA